MARYLEFPRLLCLFTMQLLWATMTIKGSLQMKILYRGIFVEDFPSPKMGQKFTVFGGLDRECCECQSSDSPSKSNYTETRHPVQKNMAILPKMCSPELGK